jgi:hypothetical protein
MIVQCSISGEDFEPTDETGNFDISFFDKQAQEGKMNLFACKAL